MRRVVLLALVVTCLVPASAHAWTWPAGGQVLRPFVLGSDPYAGGQHRGIDVAGDLGAAVSAPASGTVSFAGTVPKGGKTVSIRTPDGYTVTLQHLGSISVRKGDSVAEGFAVASVGTSGEPDWSEPYVYLGIRVTSDEQGYVDPQTLLPVRPAAGAGEPSPGSGTAPDPAPTGSPPVATHPHPRAAPPATAPAPTPQPDPSPPAVEPVASSTPAPAPVPSPPVAPVVPPSLRSAQAGSVEVGEAPASHLPFG